MIKNIGQAEIQLGRYFFFCMSGLCENHLIPDNHIINFIRAVHNPRRAERF